MPKNPSSRPRQNPVEETPSASPRGELPDLPLIDIFSKSPSDVKNLLQQINAILRQRLKNEFIIAEALDEGLSSEKLNFHDAVKMHNGSKDSIGDLVKIKQLLQGAPTANETHFYFTNVQLSGKTDDELIDLLLGRKLSGNFPTREVIR